MSTSNLSAFTPLTDGSGASAELWNRPYRQLQANVVSLESRVSTEGTKSSDISTRLQGWNSGSFSTVIRGNTEFDSSAFTFESRITLLQNNAPGIVMDGSQLSITSNQVGMQEFGGQLFLQARGNIVHTIDRDDSGTDASFNIAHDNNVNLFRVLEDGRVRLLQQTSAATNPTLQFGDGDTGFFEHADDELRIATAGIDRFKIIGNTFRGSSISGGAILNEAATATNPTLIPDTNDVDSGLGHGGDNIVSIIAGGTETIRVSDGTVRIPETGAKPTGLQSGNTGDFSWTTQHVYYCVSANSWRRAALVPF